MASCIIFCVKIIQAQKYLCSNHGPGTRGSKCGRYTTDASQAELFSCSLFHHATLSTLQLLKFQALVHSEWPLQLTSDQENVCYVDMFLISLQLRMSVRSPHATVSGRNSVYLTGDETLKWWTNPGKVHSTGPENEQVFPDCSAPSYFSRSWVQELSLDSEY